MSEDSKQKKAQKTLENILESIKSEGGKIAGLAIASYLLGLTTGAIGKQIGGDWKYAVPSVLPGMDLMAGKITPYIFPYAIGVATNYSEQICEAGKTFFS